MFDVNQFWWSCCHSLFSSFGVCFIRHVLSLACTFYASWLVLLSFSCCFIMPVYVVQITWPIYVIQLETWRHIIISNPSLNFIFSFYHAHFMEALFSLLSNIWWRNALFMFTWTAYILNWNLWAGSATSVVAANLEHEKSRLSRGLGHSQPKILCWCSTSAAISVLQFIHQYLVLSKLTILSFQKCPSPCFLKVMLHTPNDFFSIRAKSLIMWNFFTTAG
jgi:hypothetical protein